jgi:hypothetical protein
VDDRTTLKWILREYALDSSGSGWGPMAAPFGHGNGLSSFIKDGEIFSKKILLFYSYV